MLRRALVPSLIALVTASPCGVLAQESEPKTCEATQVLEAYGLGTASDDLARMAQDVGAAPLRPELFRRPGDRSIPLCDGGPPLPLGRKALPPGPGPTLELLPGVLDAYGNTTYPRDSNDGALWQGKGVSSQLAAGASFRWGILSAAVAPSLAWQQNATFPIVPNGQSGNLAFMNPWYGDTIDLPQRFGDSPFWTASPGQSYLRLDWQGFAAGFSTENMWWGPAMRNSIIMSNTAAGFPHVFVGTGPPMDVWIGKVEAHVYSGRLDRSRYFSDRRHAWFYALVFDYEPRWVPGLYLGFARVAVKKCDCLWGDDDPNGLLSLYGRWVFPQAGFEVYGEWAREDYAATFRDLMLEPDHSQAFTVGLQKVWTGASWVRLRAEATDLAPLRPPRSWRNLIHFYTHDSRRHYTNGGQYLGAAIGPGGSSQYLGVDVLTGSGWYGGYLERVRRHEEVYLYQTGDRPGGNDVELTVGLRWARSFGQVDVGVELALSHRHNRDFLRDENNAHLGVEVVLWPPPGKEPVR